MRFICAKVSTDLLRFHCAGADLRTEPEIRQFDDSSTDNNEFESIAFVVLFNAVAVILIFSDARRIGLHFSTFLLIVPDAQRNQMPLKNSLLLSLDRFLCGKLMLAICIHRICIFA